MTNKESFGFLLTGRQCGELCAHLLSGANSIPITCLNRTPQEHKAFPAASYPFNAVRHSRRQHIANEACPRGLFVSIHRAFAADAMISDQVEDHAASAFKQTKACGLASRLRDGFIDQFDIHLIVSAYLSLRSRIKASLRSAAAHLPKRRIGPACACSPQPWRDI